VLSEVSVGNPPSLSADRGVQPCTDVGLSVDRLPVPVRAFASPSELLAGRPVPVVACGPVRLSEGWHQLDASTATTVDLVRLTASGVAASSPAAAATVRVTSARAMQLRVTVDAPSGGVLVTGRSFNSGWRATANGADLGPPGRFDGVTGWHLPKGHSNVVVRFQPQRTYVAAIVVSALAIVYCGWQFLRRRAPT
jgi:arabinofuranan 3-O-arabinosyltransferase